MSKAMFTYNMEYSTLTFYKVLSCEPFKGKIFFSNQFKNKEFLNINFLMETMYQIK